MTKRGRPTGSKNKPKTVEVQFNNNKKVVKLDKPISNIDDFSKTLMQWDEMEKQIDWEAIAKKQEEKLMAYMAENEDLAQICISRWEEIQHLKYLVSYLEGKHEDSSV